MQGISRAMCTWQRRGSISDEEDCEPEASERRGYQYIFGTWDAVNLVTPVPIL
jgi:hypothetical protein